MEDPKPIDQFQAPLTVLQAAIPFLNIGSANGDVSHKASRQAYEDDRRPAVSPLRDHASSTLAAVSALLRTLIGTRLLAGGWECLSVDCSLGHVASGGRIVY